MHATGRRRYDVSGARGKKGERMLVVWCGVVCSRYG